MAELADWLHHESITRAATNTATGYIPPADVVERKHGKWIWQLADNGWADNICSVCGYTINEDIHVCVDYNFCPNCGADMRN